MDLHHYTDAGAVNGILSQEGLKFRATRFSNLNDSMEFRWIDEKISPDKEKLSQQFGLTYDPDSHVYPYVICFCDLDDDLLMWKLYGKGCRGFMLTLDYDIIAEFAKNPYGDGNNPDVLQGVAYADEADWLKKFDTANRMYRQSNGGDHSGDLDEVAALIKREIYSHENETRYMRALHDTVKFEGGNGTIKEMYDGEDLQDLKFRGKDDGIVPYLEIVFPKDALKKITIGSDLNFEVQRSALQLLLAQNGYNGVEIEQSKVIK